MTGPGGVDVAQFVLSLVSGDTGDNCPSVLCSDTGVSSPICIKWLHPQLKEDTQGVKN